MKIEILGPGCPRCIKTMGNAKEAVERSGIQAEVIKVSDLNKIMNYGVMMTPALVIDGEVKFSGKIPSVEEIEGLLNKS